MESSSYDELPYTSYPYFRTAPDRMCALARLFGLVAAPPSLARVLELGCASGGNIVPLAERWPEAHFVGIDLSERQIEEGNAIIAETGLSNVELRHASILDVDASWGRFDYVVCHGVYSWVPTEVQDHILAICRTNLADNGVAYVSYNTYPGWHMRESVRHMMRFHVRGFDSRREQAAQARALVDFLAKAVEPQAGPYSSMLQRELALLAPMGDDYIYHEHLEEQNTPIYFHEFAERLERHEMQYLCESDVHMMLAREFTDEVCETLDRIAPDLVMMEQYVDFVRNRQFRASLVCRRAVPLQRALGPATIMGLRFGLPAVPGPALDLAPDLAQEVTTVDGLKIGSAQSITKAALGILREIWPADVAFVELVDRAVARCREAGLAVVDDDATRVTLGSDLLECVATGAGLDLRTEPPPLAPSAGERPRVGRTTLATARRHRFVTNARHQRVELDQVSKFVILACDGQRDRAAILEFLVDRVHAGELVVEHDDPSSIDRDVLRDGLRPSVDTALAQLARLGVFEA